LKIRIKINDIGGKSACYNNMAIVYMSQNYYSKAIEFYSKSLVIDEKRNDERGIADSYNNIGVCYMDLKQYDKAISYFEKSILISKKHSMSSNIQNATSNLGTVYRKKKQFDLAKKYLNESLSLSLKSGDIKNSAYCYQILTQIASEEKDYKNAYLYSDKYYSIEKKRIGEINIRQITALEVKHKYEKEKEIEQEKLARSKAESKMNATLLISACIVLLFVLFMSFFLYRKWKQAQEQKQEIDLKNNLLNEQNLEIYQSISYAQRIQDALLPSFEKINSIFQKNRLLYLPKDIISGDFYWTFETKTHKYIAVADCTGHGVPGAMMNMICHNALNRSILEFQCTMPGEILTKTRDIIVAELSRKDENVNDGMDISLIAIDSTTQQLFWSGAHNDLWILRKESKSIETINALNQPIGKHIGYSNFETHEFFVETGDRIVLLTDGFGDQFGGPKNKKFKDSNLKKLLLENQSKSLIENCEILEKTFFDWKKDEAQIDDVCILLIEI
jgi:serine phosphatase RsbU (regulator of sigma subunit)/Tfp pilus assembly protein PilF